MTVSLPTTPIAPKPTTITTPVALDHELTILFPAAIDEPAGILHRTSENYAPNAQNSERINATLLSLVRNDEIDGMVQAMGDLERTWNHKFNYPWTFFNDVPFTDEFKKRTSEATKAECRYGAWSRNLPFRASSHLFFPC